MKNWNWPTVDEGRVKRAKTVKFSSLSTSSDVPTARAIGSGSEDYAVTLDSCTCADFAMTQAKGNPTPCKHMLALAMKSGILNENGNTPAQQKAADLASLRNRLATAYGFYHLVKSPILTDAEYDAMKKEYQSMNE